MPLNAGNVLGAEDNGPAAKWLSLIREALNNNNNISHSVVATATLTFGKLQAYALIVMQPWLITV